MDVMDAIQRRRSVRHFKPDEIPEEVLEKLLNALRLAPSGGNCQPWKFVVIRDKALKTRVTSVCGWKTADGKKISQDWIDEAPVMIVACGIRKEARVGYYEAGELYIMNWESLK